MVAACADRVIKDSASPEQRERPDADRNLWHGVVQLQRCHSGAGSGEADTAGAAVQPDDVTGQAGVSAGAAYWVGMEGRLRPLDEGMFVSTALLPALPPCPTLSKLPSAAQAYHRRRSVRRKSAEECLRVIASCWRKTIQAVNFGLCVLLRCLARELHQFEGSGSIAVAGG